MSKAGKANEEVKESRPKETPQKSDIEDFEWLEYEDPSSQRGRITAAFIQNPLVPIGATATVIALACGIWQMRKNNSVKQQFYMRARVGAQGFTIASLVGGLFYQSHLRDTENQAKLQSKQKQTQGSS